MSIENTVGLCVLGGTASQDRGPAPDYKLRLLTADEIAHRLHPDIQASTNFILWDFPIENSSDIRASNHWEPIFSHQYGMRHLVGSIVDIMGTNALSYTAAADSFANAEDPAQTPKVYAAGQRHQGRALSDSLANIEMAVVAAKAMAQLGVREVAVLRGSEGQIARGTRIVKGGDNPRRIFHSPIGFPDIGVVPAHGVKFSDHAYHPEPGSVNGEFVLRPEFFMDKIYDVNLNADMNPAFMDVLVDAGYKAIILRSFETGNVPSYLLDRIKSVVEKGVQVIVVPNFDEPDYSSLMPIEELNAVQSGAVTAPGELTGPALAVKVAWYLAYPEYFNQKCGSFQNFLNTNFAGEQTGPRGGLYVPKEIAIMPRDLDSDSSSLPLRSRLKIAAELILPGELPQTELGVRQIIAHHSRFNLERRLTEAKFGGKGGMPEFFITNPEMYRYYISPTSAFLLRHLMANPNTYISLREVARLYCKDNPGLKGPQVLGGMKKAIYVIGDLLKKYYGCKNKAFPNGFIFTASEVHFDSLDYSLVVLVDPATVDSAV